MGTGWRITHRQRSQRSFSPSCPASLPLPHVVLPCASLCACCAASVTVAVSRRQQQQREGKGRKGERREQGTRVRGQQIGGRAEGPWPELRVSSLRLPLLPGRATVPLEFSPLPQFQTIPFCFSCTLTLYCASHPALPFAFPPRLSAVALLAPLHSTVWPVILQPTGTLFPFGYGAVPGRREDLESTHCRGDS
jgi:hypothetical protein